MHLSRHKYCIIILDEKSNELFPGKSVIVDDIFDTKYQF